MSFFRMGDRGLIYTTTGPRSVNFPANGYGALSDGRLWLNVFYQQNWGRDHVLVDEVRTGTPLRAVTPGGVSDAGLLATMMATADADGYPTVLPVGVGRWSTFILTEQGADSAPAIGGRYRLDWQGTGTMTATGAATGVVTGANYVEFDFTPTDVNFVDISCTSMTPGDHVRGVRCYKTSHAGHLNSGKKVHPAFREAWGGVKLLRWMQAQRTNEAGAVDWSTRATSTSVGRYMSIDDMIDVCNEMGMDGWWCIPHLADEAYVTAMATRIRDRLNPALKCYVEYSNEWWNWGPGYVGAPFFGAMADAESNVYGFQEAAGAWAGRAMEWWSAVFSGQMTRTVRVFGTQVNYLGLETNALTAVNYRALHPEFPIPHTVHDAIAVTAYMVPPYGFATARWETVIATATSNYAAGLAQLETFLEENIEQYRTWLYPHFRTVCDSYGKDLVMYEGGTHLYALPGLSNMALVRQLVADTNRGEAMYRLTAKMMEVWDGVADGPFNYYVSCQEPNTDGEFSAQHYINDFTQPRYRAAMEYNDGVIPADPGTPVGGQSFDMYGMVNSLYNHGAGTGTIHTRVGNYLVRMSAQAPTPNTITSGLFFGFVEDWPTPPVYGGSMASEELTSPYINFSADWVGAANIEKVFMVLDNIFGYLVAPDAVNSQGSVYLTEMLRILDQWEANAPNASREYILYSPWHYLRQSGVTIPPTTMPSGAITEPGHLEWYQATLVDYQAWSDSLLAMMQAARPTLNITMHKVGMALCTAHRDIPAIHSMDIADLFFDIAHGKPSWYLMAAIAEYICLFGEKPAADLVIDPAWGIHPTVEANYQVIVDHMWGVLTP